MVHGNSIQEYLKKLDISETLCDEIMRFREKFVPDISARAVAPQIAFYGAETIEMSAAALLQGANLLLCGPKATGKNVLAENLAYIFGRPVYNMSFHVNTDSAALIGADTFINNEVRLRKGPVTLCAEQGGFGIFDEVNMAKNEAVAVLHAALDHRRIIDVPGYDLIALHEATRFIGTMNYGYAGTRELNEALVSRFLVVEMPAPDEQTLDYLLQDAYPTLKVSARKQLCGLFLDLIEKNENGELSTKSIDLRGLISAIGTVKLGVSVKNALKMGLGNKSFDGFEKDIIDDAMTTRFPDNWKAADLFED